MRERRTRREEGMHICERRKERKEGKKGGCRYTQINGRIHTNDRKHKNKKGKEKMIYAKVMKVGRIYTKQRYKRRIYRQRKIGRKRRMCRKRRMY
jgi:hypothetical protein